MTLIDGDPPLWCLDYFDSAVIVDNRRTMLEEGDIGFGISSESVKSDKRAFGCSILNDDGVILTISDDINYFFIFTNGEGRKLLFDKLNKVEDEYSISY